VQGFLQEAREWRCFDVNTRKDSAREIREYFIPDFSQWKHHDSYQKAFGRLLKDLQTDAAKPAPWLLAREPPQSTQHQNPA
jgi:hypothetical protein